MNNKGFAITSILYGLLVMFLLIVVGTLGVLANQKRLMEELTDGTQGARDIVKLEIIDIDDNYFGTAAPARALYVYTYVENDIEKTCKRYFDKGDSIDRLDFVDNSNCIP